MDEIQRKLKKLAKGSTMRGTDAGSQYKSGNSPTSDHMGSGADMPPPPDPGKPINTSGIIEVDKKTTVYVGKGGDKESVIASAMATTNTDLVEWGSWDKGRKTFTPSGEALEVDSKGKGLTQVKGDINVDGKVATFTKSLTSDVKGRV